MIAEKHTFSGDARERFGHPRPQFRRDDWACLNGPWDFAIDREAAWSGPGEVQWDRRIEVPYAPETSASGIGDESLYKSVWYRRRLALPPQARGHRVLLHFGAVDTAATVWVNGQLAGKHRGGYTPFCFDITDLLVAGDQTVVVRAVDDPLDLTKPRGKQDWKADPHSIWYPRTTGIWQTVWLEWVPETWVDYIRWTPVLERWEIAMEARIGGESRDAARLRVRLEYRDRLLSDDTYAIVNGEVYRGIRLSDPGIDDGRNELLWRPACPNLIDATLELIAADGRIIDRVQSYTALRSIGIQGNSFVLNGRPLPLRMVLDQGYWPETGLTPPDDAAARRDVELALAMGFNGVRRHQKISDPRYLYWADQLGLLVWAEMPSAYRFTKRSVKQVYQEWTEAIDRDVSHPCIVAWVPLNESWGVPDLPDSPSQRHYVKALYHLTKTLDPTRPVIGNDGWESVATDIIAIHDYEPSPQRLVSRYGADDRSFAKLVERERPAGRLLALDELSTEASRPIMLTEFGGVCYAHADNGTWGYSRVHSSDELLSRYADLMRAVRSLPLFSGFCYTQFADTYQEANGLLYADRTPKIPLAAIAAATLGPEALREMQAVAGPENRDRRVEAIWRERLMADRIHHVQDVADEHKIG